LDIAIKNRPEDKPLVRAALAQFAREHQLAPSVVRAFDLALEEFITNILSYAYNDGKEHRILVSFQFGSAEVCVRLEDDGKRFNPLDQPAPDVTLPLADKPLGGLGIYMARKSVDRMEYVRRKGRNVLTLVKKI